MPIERHDPFRSLEQTHARLEVIRVASRGRVQRRSSAQGLVDRPRYGDAYRLALRPNGDFVACKLDR